MTEYWGQGVLSIQLDNVYWALTVYHHCSRHWAYSGEHTRLKWLPSGDYFNFWRCCIFSLFLFLSYFLQLLLKFKLLCAAHLCTHVQKGSTGCECWFGMRRIILILVILGNYEWLPNWHATAFNRMISWLRSCTYTHSEVKNVNIHNYSFESILFCLSLSFGGIYYTEIYVEEIKHMYYENMFNSL